MIQLSSYKLSNIQTTLYQSENLTFEKAWFMFQETHKKFQARDEKLNKLERLFTSQRSKLMESLVEGDIKKLLNHKGIPVNETLTRIKGFDKKEQFEFDIIAENGNDIVVVEVKTTLRPNDVKHFLSKLKEFKLMLPKYNENNVLGGIAYLTDDGNASQMAHSKGLFVIKATGSSAIIVNNEDFKPKFWSNKSHTLLIKCGSDLIVSDII